MADIAFPGPSNYLGLHQWHLRSVGPVQNLVCGGGCPKRGIIGLCGSPWRPITTCDALFAKINHSQGPPVSCALFECWLLIILKCEQKGPRCHPSLAWELPRADVWCPRTSWCPHIDHGATRASKYYDSTAFLRAPVHPTTPHSNQDNWHCLVQNIQGCFQMQCCRCGMLHCSKKQLKNSM